MPGGYSQPPGPLFVLKGKGTRSWIKVAWTGGLPGNSGYRVFWSADPVRPAAPSLVLPAAQSDCYIRDVREDALYYVWVEGYAASGVTQTARDTVRASRSWVLDSSEAGSLDISSSAAVPEGMRLFWHDEFNDSLLDRNKWFTDYYSNLDYFEKVKVEEMRQGRLPQAAYTLNGHSIRLFANDSLPLEPFLDGKKISSIQTYDWSTQENLLDNSRGGYFEVRVRRSYSGKPQGLNTAFWFDSPGPDLKYYFQEGTVVDGVRGIRPKGQLFEIDIFENLDAQFVMHGHVDTNGRFIHNLATDIARGFEHRDQWVTHGILWTPVSIKHYINGKLIKAYDNKHQIFSPNHFMNILLGSYGKGGEVSMEVDYIRGYQWPVSAENELPNGDFERNATMAPWEGSGRLVGRSGRQAVALRPGDSIEQYVYLDNDREYALTCAVRGQSMVEAEVDNVEAVTGGLTVAGALRVAGKRDFSSATVRFRTGRMYGKDMKTVRVVFRNKGKGEVVVDDVRVVKVG